MWKLSNFFTKTMECPLWKNANFSGFFLLLVFMVEKVIFFSFQNIIKHFIFILSYLYKKVGKIQFFYQNHGLTTLEECHFLEFFQSLFSQYGKASFFLSTISPKTFSCLIYQKYTSGKMSIFQTNANFSILFTPCFYSLESFFFFLEYHQKRCSSLFCLKQKRGKNPFFWPKP